MGIYSDLQADLSEAFSGDLLDATTTLSIVEESVGTYNPATGSPTITETTSIMRCVRLDYGIGENMEDDTSTDFTKILVLDSEKTVAKFSIGVKAILDGFDYIVKGVSIDPTKSSHTLKLRRG